MSRCSTPFGIIGIFTASLQWHPGSPPGCSTPFGIIGIFTTRTTSASQTGDGAQRLSASLESSRVYEVVGLVRGAMCSTPFGIIGIFTSDFSFSFHCSSSCSTPFGIIGIFTALSFALDANRVLCSTPFGIIGIFTGRPRPANSRAPRAQRLSASLESSLTRICVSRCSSSVLNAFRHHWNLHAWDCGRSRHSRRVLNAFRHHWNLHTIRIIVAGRAHECSTPFGIIGIFTSA